MFCSTPIDEAEAAVDRRHPLGVAAGQVVVDGHDVDALAGERVERDGERGGQRLALAGLHLGDRAAVQHHAADHLDVEVAHAHRAARRLADDRERLGQQVVERLAVGGRARAAQSAWARSSSSSSSSSSGSQALMGSTRFAYCLNCLPSPSRRARSRIVMDQRIEARGTRPDPGCRIRPAPLPGCRGLARARRRRPASAPRASASRRAARACGGACRGGA